MYIGFIIYSKKCNSIYSKLVDYLQILSWLKQFIHIHENNRKYKKIENELIII